MPFRQPTVSIAAWEEIQSHRVGALQQLADMRLDVIQEADIDDLDRLHRQALELLQSHTDYIEQERTAIESASSQIADLETKRADLASEHQALETKIENKLANIEVQLKNDATYRSLVDAFDGADANRGTSRAETSLLQSMSEKRKAPLILSDPLFSYLWAARLWHNGLQRRRSVQDGRVAGSPSSASISKAHGQTSHA